ncbi:hypothetical protein PanWU01x14_228240, partial [Parasponia andersonii]
MVDWFSPRSNLMSKTNICSPSVVNTLYSYCRTLRTKLFSYFLNLLARVLVTGPTRICIGSRIFTALISSSVLDWQTIPSHLRLSKESSKFEPTTSNIQDNNVATKPPVYLNMVQKKMITTYTFLMKKL